MQSKQYTHSQFTPQTVSLPFVLLPYNSLYDVWIMGKCFEWIIFHVLTKNKNKNNWQFSASIEIITSNTIYISVKIRVHSWLQ